MSKHTPAPWVLKIRPAEHDDNVTVAEIEQPRSVKYRGAVTRMQSAEHIYGIGKDELIANARLIAAAPDMLEALKAISEVGIREIHDWQAIAERMQATALAAIAKAEGV
jgi:hypothetical protein